MSNLIFSTAIIFSIIVMFVNWGLHNAYPQ
jgi:hypothetical protein